MKQTEGQPCNKLVDDGYTPGACQMLTSGVGEAVALSEQMGTSERVLVFTLRGRQATLALRETRTLQSAAAGGYQGQSQIFVSDLAGDGQQKLVITTPKGDGGQLELADLDVVEASGAVVLHRQLDGGQARKAPVGGGLETYTAAPGGMVTDTIIRYSDGQWRFVSAMMISSSAVPSSTGTY